MPEFGCHWKQFCLNSQASKTARRSVLWHVHTSGSLTPCLRCFVCARPRMSHDSCGSQSDFPCCHWHPLAFIIQWMSFFEFSYKPYQNISWGSSHEWRVLGACFGGHHLGLAFSPHPVISWGWGIHGFCLTTCTWILAFWQTDRQVNSNVSNLLKLNKIRII